MSINNLNNTITNSTEMRTNRSTNLKTTLPMNNEMRANRSANYNNTLPMNNEIGANNPTNIPLHQRPEFISDAELWNDMFGITTTLTCTRVNDENSKTICVTKKVTKTQNIDNKSATKTVVSPTKSAPKPTTKSPSKSYYDNENNKKVWAPNNKLEINPSKMVVCNDYLLPHDILKELKKIENQKEVICEEIEEEIKKPIPIRLIKNNLKNVFGSYEWLEHNLPYIILGPEDPRSKYLKLKWGLLNMLDGSKYSAIIDGVKVGKKIINGVKVGKQVKLYEVNPKTGNSTNFLKYDWFDSETRKTYQVKYQGPTRKVNKGSNDSKKNKTKMSTGTGMSQRELHKIIESATKQHEDVGEEGEFQGVMAAFLPVSVSNTDNSEYEYKIYYVPNEKDMEILNNIAYLPSESEFISHDFGEDIEYDFESILARYNVYIAKSHESDKRLSSNDQYSGITVDTTDDQFSDYEV